MAILSCAAIAGQQAPASPPPPLFDFHSGFWINLHHFLYVCAQEQAQAAGRRPALTDADRAEWKQLPAADAAAWNEAVAFYAGSMIKRDLLFDNGMREMKNRLEDAETSPDLKEAQIGDDVKNALVKAAPVYRRHWWTRHNDENHRWIAQLQPLVVTHGAGLSSELARIYGVPWPQYPVRVDTVAYANWAGAYTSIEPTRVTVSTTEASNRGAAALEVVFHEASHGMMDKVMQAMRAAEAKVNAHRAGAPFEAGSLWHAVLFYTAGELVAQRIRGYVPYAAKNGLWARGWKDPERELIERDWGPHMRGEIPLENALDKLVADLAAAQSH